MKNKLLTTRIKNTPCKFTGKNQTDLLLEKCRKNEGDYFLELTGYTDKITDQSGNSTIVAPSDMRNQVFIASKKIIKDYNESEIIIENIPRGAIHYFSHKRKPFQYDEAVIIDIKAAYPSILKSTGIITEDTYEYLMNLRKSERLKSIGMLATKKIKLKLNQNQEKPEIIPTEEGKYADLYFYAAYEIGEILKQCENIAKGEFLFFWFDGIYLKGRNWQQVGEVCEIIKNAGLNYSVGVLKNFYTKKTKNGNLKIGWTEIRNSEKGIYTNPKEKILILPNKPQNFYR